MEGLACGATWTPWKAGGFKALHHDPKSVILEEDIDENYEPTDAEIEEYANWLGMTSPEDDDLRWIAREGLKAPLPEHWKPCKTDDGEVYYFNFADGRERVGPPV